MSSQNESKSNNNILDVNFIVICFSSVDLRNRYPVDGGVVYFIPTNIELHPDLQKKGYLQCSFQNPHPDSVENRMDYIYPWLSNKNIFRMRANGMEYIPGIGLIILKFDSSHDNFGAKIQHKKTNGQLYNVKVHKHVFATNSSNTVTTELENVPAQFTNLVTLYPGITDQKIKYLQNFCRRNLKYFRFKRWIKTREFIEWIYSPENIGGKVSIKSLEKFTENV